jgi:chromosomal replication initiation ATPase DnaA
VRTRNKKRARLLCRLVDALRMRYPADKYSVSQTIKILAGRYGVSVDDLKSDSRVEHLTAVRQLCWCVLYQEGTWGSGGTRSMPGLGRYFNRDHTTVLHALRRFGFRS